MTSEEKFKEWWVSLPIETPRVPIILCKMAWLEATRQAYAEAIKICDDLKVDKDRCRSLILIEQAWEEGQWACSEALQAKLKKLTP